MNGNTAMVSRGRIAEESRRRLSRTGVPVMRAADRIPAATAGPRRRTTPCGAGSARSRRASRRRRQPLGHIGGERGVHVQVEGGALVHSVDDSAYLRECRPCGASGRECSRVEVHPGRLSEHVEALGAGDLQDAIRIGDENDGREAGGERILEAGEPLVLVPGRRLQQPFVRSEPDYEDGVADRGDSGRSRQFEVQRGPESAPCFSTGPEIDERRALGRAQSDPVGRAQDLIRTPSGSTKQGRVTSTSARRPSAATAIRSPMRLRPSSSTASAMERPRFGLWQACET